MTKSQLLAHFIRTEEAGFHLEEAMHDHNAADARNAATLLEIADQVELVPDDDLRIVEMERAHYFTSGTCVPGDEGRSFIQAAYSEGVTTTEPFIDGLAEASRLDGAAWDSAPIPDERRHLGWNQPWETHGWDLNAF